MKFRGSVRYGNSYPDSTIAMWPLAKLNVAKETLEVSLPWRRFLFPRKNVTRLIKYTGFVAIGIQIEHTLLEQPNLIVFWTYHFGDIKTVLQKQGYTFVARR